MIVSLDRDIILALEKMAITLAIINDDLKNSHLHFEEKIFQAIDHLKEVSHKRPDIDSIFYFINKPTDSKMAKESLEEIITDHANKNFIMN